MDFVLSARSAHDGGHSSRRYEQLNDLWRAVLVEPKTLPRLMLKAHLEDKRRAKAKAAVDSRPRAAHDPTQPCREPSAAPAGIEVATRLRAEIEAAAQLAATQGEPPGVSSFRQVLG